MVVIPSGLNKVAAHAAMIKNITRLDINIPDQMSTLIFLTSCVDVLALRNFTVVLPRSISSSTSWEVCQKNKYGDIVVPSTAQISKICSDENVMRGMTADFKTSGQSMFKLITA